ncbi:MAG: aromatic ring-hydroxylating dioxygenase subunit alpha, partial [Actinomycetota bacterium]
MRHDEQVRLIKELCAHLDAGTTVDAGGLRRNPTSIYTDPDQAEREWDEWFRGMPQLIGMSGDLPGPGSFLTTDDAGTPVLATRDDDGRFRAFVNSCRHRGALVEDEPRGSRRRFTCPFHNWSYDSAGALVGLPRPDHFGDVDRDCSGLRELPAEERHGLLFVHVDPDGDLDLDWLLGDWFNDEFSTWAFDELELATSDEYDTRCNWKLAMDTFGETYHFTALHSETLALSFHGNVQCYDEDGHLHRMILCKRAIDEIRTLPEDQWDITFAGLPVYWIFPNVILMPFEVGVFLVRAFPVPGDPGRHVSRIDFYLRPEAVRANADRMAISDLEELSVHMARSFGDIIRDEDYAMGASQQRAADAGALDEIV